MIGSKLSMTGEIKFLADVNIERPIVEFLQENGYDTKWIPDLDCKMVDQQLLEMANKEKRILITNDKDFGELTFRQKRISTGIILFRVKNQKSRDKIRLLQKLLLVYGHKLKGNFIVLTQKKFRIISMESIL
jgi:predicted nuclease of predicted toxin-antitoxin system